jgi:hypothetical protein
VGEGFTFAHAQCIHSYQWVKVSLSLTDFRSRTIFKKRICVLKIINNNCSAEKSL